MTQPVEYTNLYRFGNPNVRWIGETQISEFREYHADSPREAWLYGQSKWLVDQDATKGNTAEYLVCLERKCLVAAPLRLSGPRITVDRRESSVWVRVAEGYADAAWPGDKAGGLFRFYSNGVCLRNRVDPTIDLPAEIERILGQKDKAVWVEFARVIDEALSKDRGEYTRKHFPESPIWVTYAFDEKYLALLFSVEAIVDLRAFVALVINRYAEPPITQEKV